MDDIALRIDSVSKQFLLPHEKKTTVKSLFTGLFKQGTTTTRQQALKNISFEVKKGEFFGIVGRNGSGKSTLLKIIAGIYQPTQGSVRVNGRLVPFIELGVGFNPELTGRENVFLNGAILGFTRKQIEANYKKIVEFAELEPFMDQKLKNYSSGMQVRLAFACATMANAEVLLIDEVLAVGDADFQRKCFDYFKQLKKVGTTVIFVTHDMNAVREYCDRAILINDSKLVLEGTPEKIAEEYTKLFSTVEQPAEKIDNSQRWGTGDIRFISPPKINITNNKININVKAKPDKSIPELIFGFSIVSPDGKDIVGTNTKILKKKIVDIEKGSVIDISWMFENLFNSGKYDCNVTCTSPDGATVYDWWNAATRFTIINNESTPYGVAPKVDFKADIK